jgi:hypothetical protein
VFLIREFKSNSVQLTPKKSTIKSTEKIRSNIQQPSKKAIKNSFEVSINQRLLCLKIVESFEAKKKN